MGLNLHSIVRAAINAVNPEIAGQYVASTGYTQDASYAQVPSYAAPVTVPMQVQSLSGKDLQHKDLLNVQGVVRAVYLFGNVQGLVRVDAKGGDLLRFPQTREPGALVYTWKVVAVLETWTPTAPGWCKVAVALQTDEPTIP